MNINEIKDSLQRNNFTGLRARLDSVIEFIDSQQAEIEALKIENSHLKYEISSGAWNPVKELTDEEIGDFTHRMVLCCGVNPNSADINVLGLKFIVEDILRKAQEK